MCRRKIVNTISHSWKNKIRKIDFPFGPAVCASIIKIGPLLRFGGEGENLPTPK